MVLYARFRYRWLSFLIIAGIVLVALPYSKPAIAEACPDGQPVVNGLLVPRLKYRPILGDALAKRDRTPLFPVPSDDGLNPALFTRIPRNSLLHILARAEPKFGEWLYIELDLPERGAEFGFVRRESADFSGSMSQFPIIEVSACDSTGQTSGDTPTFDPPQAIRTRDFRVDGISLTIPNDWIFHDFTSSAQPSEKGFIDYIKTVPPLRGTLPKHLFVAAAPNVDDPLQFGVFYLGSYEIDSPEMSASTSQDLDALEKLLEKRADQLPRTMEGGKLVESTVRRISGYPFVFTHFTRANFLSLADLKGKPIRADQNVLHVYQLTTYRSGKWYMALITGLEPTTATHLTIINRLYIP